MSELNPGALLGAYGALQKELGLPKLEATRIEVETERVEECRHDDLLAQLEGWRSGWIAFRSGLAWFSPTRALRAADLELGWILEAELAGESESLRIWLDGAPGSGWRLATLRETDTGGESCLAEELTLLSETWTSGGGNLRYRRYWAPARAQGMRPRHARFLGFAEREA